MWKNTGSLNTSLLMGWLCYLESHAWMTVLKRGFFLHAERFSSVNLLCGWFWVGISSIHWVLRWPLSPRSLPISTPFLGLSFSAFSSLLHKTSPQTFRVLCKLIHLVDDTVLKYSVYLAVKCKVFCKISKQLNFGSFLVGTTSKSFECQNTLKRHQKPLEGSSPLDQDVTN